MNAPLFFRILCLLGVLTSGMLYFQIRNQKLQLEDNLNQSRSALQYQLSESAQLKSRTFQAEETCKQVTDIAEEERTKAAGFREQFEGLRQRAEAAEAAQERTEDELQSLKATNRDLQRENNNLQASVPPKNWREQMNDLQSRNLELEAENTSLRRSLTSASQTANVTVPPPRPQGLDRPTQSVGEVVRIGPDGSFAIINYGRSKGAAEGQTLSILRNNQTIALVSLTNITNDFSVAQILSATNTDNGLSVPNIQVGDTAHLNL